jgi:hypothetical protein
MKQLLAILLLLAFGLGAVGQKADTVSIGKNDLQIQNLQLGNSTYLIYFKTKVEFHG